MIIGKGSFEINRISGYLPSKLMFFLMNVNAKPKTVWLTRHGESGDNRTKKIGGTERVFGKRKQNIGVDSLKK